MDEDRMQEIMGEYIGGLAIAIAAGLEAATPERVPDIARALDRAAGTQPPLGAEVIARIAEALRLRHPGTP